MQAYHDHLGRFGAIFGEYQPADLVEVQRLHQVSREIELKRQLLDSQGANLELSLCPLLCAPMTWAASKWSTSKAKAEGMLKYSDKEIHRPLVRLEELAPHALDKKGQVEKKEAQRLTKELGAQFKNLLGWMGVKKATYPEALAEEWLRYGVANEGHRCELYALLLLELGAAPSSLPPLLTSSPPLLQVRPRDRDQPRRAGAAHQRPVHARPVHRGRRHARAQQEGGLAERG